MRERKNMSMVLLTLMLVTMIGLQNVISAGCGLTEYPINGQCCLMCVAGERVDKHCNGITNTSCKPCGNGTFADKPNNQTECINCKSCISSLGLRTKNACTASSDAECEPLDGYYCIDMKHGCIETKIHSTCNPGQAVSQQGTASTDTVCMGCTGDTYSDGTFTSCKAHTKCSSSVTVHKPGTHSTDTECGTSSPSLGGGAISGIVILLILVFCVTGFLYKKFFPHFCHNTDTLPHQETVQGEQSNALFGKDVEQPHSDLTCNLPFSSRTTRPCFNLSSVVMSVCSKPVHYMGMCFRLSSVVMSVCSKPVNYMGMCFKLPFCIHWEPDIFICSVLSISSVVNTITVLEELGKGQKKG